MKIIKYEQYVINCANNLAWEVLIIQAYRTWHNSTSSPIAGVEKFFYIILAAIIYIFSYV